MGGHTKSELFHEVNERIAELLERAWPAAPADFICECSRMECMEVVTLSLDEYRGLARRGVRVLASHGGSGTRAARPRRRAALGSLAA